MRVLDRGGIPVIGGERDRRGARAQYAIRLNATQGAARTPGRLRYSRPWAQVPGARLRWRAQRHPYGTHRRRAPSIGGGLETVTVGRLRAGAHRGAGQRCGARRACRWGWERVKFVSSHYSILRTVLLSERGRMSQHPLR